LPAIWLGEIINFRNGMTNGILSFSGFKRIMATPALCTRKSKKPKILLAELRFKGALITRHLFLIVWLRLWLNF
jgi:hypothetical protein